MDDLLPAYALVIDEICPCKEENFKEEFNAAFARFLPLEERKEKTFDNHRTEISGKLFGMYYLAEDGMVYQSERTIKYLEDSDQPAFFKDFVYKMQFPNGMQKIASTVAQRVKDGISLRPYAFLLQLLKIAKAANFDITQKMLYYYVLNSLDVLQGKATPEEVLITITSDYHNGLIREIHAIDPATGKEKADSYKTQHMREMLNYLELANLIRIVDFAQNPNDKLVVLNPDEDKVISLIANQWNVKPEFDVSSYDLTSLNDRKKIQLDWDAYYAKLSPHASEFKTDVRALAFSGEGTESTHNTAVIPAHPETVSGEENPMHSGEDNTSQQDTRNTLGDEGEALIFAYEKRRVQEFNPHLVRKVLHLGRVRGLGYDIQSVVALPGEESEYVKYIEVKSTKRLTCPDINDGLWADTFYMTRNELVAAKQHKEYYSIFRVFFTQNGVHVFVITNVNQRISDGVIQVTPTEYRIDFSRTAVDDIFRVRQEA